MAISKASAKWTGTLKEGSGSMKGGTGFFDAPFTFLSRFEGAQTGTNPEELIGAAQAHVDLEPFRVLPRIQYRQSGVDRSRQGRGFGVGHLKVRLQQNPSPKGRGR